MNIYNFYYIIIYKYSEIIMVIILIDLIGIYKIWKFYQ